MWAQVTLAHELLVKNGGFTSWGFAELSGTEVPGGVCGWWQAVGAAGKTLRGGGPAREAQVAGNIYCCLLSALHLCRVTGAPCLMSCAALGKWPPSLSLRPRP